MRVIGKISRVMYEKNGFVIGILQDINKREYKFKGYIKSRKGIKSVKNRVIDIEGEQELDRKYKNIILKGDRISLIEDSIEFMFFKRYIKHIRKPHLEKLIGWYKENMIEALDRGDRDFIAVFATKEDKVDDIINNWNKNKKKYRFFTTFNNFFEPHIIDLIFNHFIEDREIEIDKAIKMIEDNPYDALMGISGLGFKSVDKFALSIGYNKHSEIRFVYFMKYIMDRYIQSRGDTMIPLDLFEKELHNSLDDLSIDYKQFKFMYILKKAIENNHIILTEDRDVMLTSYSDKELYILKELKRRANLESKHRIDNIDEYIKKYEKENDIKFTDEQRYAIKMVNGSNCSIISGYAGVGKSFISKVILDMNQHIIPYDNIIVTSLSGIATDRIRKYSGYNGITCAGLLANRRNFKNSKEGLKLKYDVILVDETSMINVDIFYEILKNAKSDSKIIFVGDESQLEPVGPGNPFEDIINMGILPRAKLTKIFRNSNYELNLFANKIRQHIFDDPSKVSSMRYNRDCDFEEFREIMRERYAPIMRDELNSGKIIDFIEDVQIICPIKKGTFGLHNINAMMKSLVNPKGGIEITYRNGTQLISNVISEGDKVLNSKNLLIEDINGLDSRIYNGMIGVVQKIGGDSVVVNFAIEGIKAVYDINLFKEAVQLAYAITVHKSQGSGFNNLIYVQQQYNRSPFFNNKLFYTAITRSKNNVELFSNDYILENLITSGENRHRKTLLRWLNDNRDNIDRDISYDIER